MHFDSASLGGRLLAAALLVFVSACGSSDRNAADRSEAASASDSPSTGAETAAARLPDNFPGDFPLPSDFQVTEGTYTEGSTVMQANFLVRGTSKQSVDDIAAFYHARLPETGYSIQSEPPAPGADHAQVYFGGGKFKDCSVQLSTAGAATNVLISLPFRE